MKKAILLATILGLIGSVALARNVLTNVRTTSVPSCELIHVVPGTPINIIPGTPINIKC